eukprot:143496-Prymnesium_polylepis.1
MLSTARREQQGGMFARGDGVPPRRTRRAQDGALTFEVAVRDADAVQIADTADEHRKARLQLWTIVDRSQLAKVAAIHQIVEKLSLAGDFHHEEVQIIRYRQLCDHANDVVAGAAHIKDPLKRPKLGVHGALLLRAGPLLKLDCDPLTETGAKDDNGRTAWLGVLGVWVGCEFQGLGPDNTVH